MSKFECWIIEDEPPAERQLRRLLGEVSPGAEVTFATDTISATLHALDTRPHPDLVFSDVQLADGLSFDIWASATCACPIVFTTAYDQYAIRAFAVNSVDYLLKPVEAAELRAALEKFERRRAAAAPAVDMRALSALVAERRPAYRERFVLQHRGGDWVSVDTDELAQCYSADGMTFGLTRERQRYLLPEPLERLAEQLDPRKWFRISRGQLVHVDAVERASPYFNHRLVVKLCAEAEAVDNVVSRGRVKGFLEWWGR